MDLTDLAPGAFAGDIGPSDNSSIPNLTPALSGLLSTANLPTPMSTSASGYYGALAPGFSSGIGIFGSGSGSYGGGLGSLFGSGASTGVASLGSSLTGSALGDALAKEAAQTGISAAQGLLINPAVYQANLPAQQQNQANALQTAATTAAIQTNSFTTIILWAAVAWGLVKLFESFASKA